MEDERDLVEFVDEDGNEVTLEVLNYFYYNGDEYATLADPSVMEACQCPPGEECTCDPAEIYFMKVIPVAGTEDEVEFEPVEDEELGDKLFEVISSEMGEEEE